MHAYIIEGNNKELIECEIEKITKRGSIKRLEFFPKKIENIREIIKLLKFSSNEKTAYILFEFENVSLEGINAMLKSLEEPPKNIIFILTTRSLYLLPSTIISRCHIIKTKKGISTTTEEINDLKAFLDFSIGEKFKFLNDYHTRESAILFVEKSIICAHKVLLEDPDKRSEMANFINLAENTISNIQLNGNTKLQLTNFAISI